MSGKIANIDLVGFSAQPFGDFGAARRRGLVIATVAAGAEEQSGNKHRHDARVHTPPSFCAPSRIILCSLRDQARYVFARRQTIAGCASRGRTGLVTWHAGVDLLRPGIDAAFDIVGFAEAEAADMFG